MLSPSRSTAAASNSATVLFKVVPALVNKGKSEGGKKTRAENDSEVACHSLIASASQLLLWLSQANDAAAATLPSAVFVFADNGNGQATRSSQNRPWLNELKAIQSDLNHLLDLEAAHRHAIQESILRTRISVQEMAKRLGEEGQEEEDGNGQENQDVDNDDLNIYHILARLQRRVELQQKSIQDRSRTVSSLLTKIQEFTKIMGPQNGWEEGQDNKDEDNDSLSLSRIARLENLVATLELEKNQRIQLVADHLEQIRGLSMELTVPFDRGDGGGMFVSQLVQSITNASSSLAMSSDNNTTTDSNHLSLQGNSGSLVSEIDAFLTSVRDARIHDHINALYLISTSTSSSSPLQSPSISSYNSFSLNSLIHSTTLDAIDRIHSLLSQEREHRVTIMQTLHDEIHMFWEQLDVPVDERRMILTSKSSSSNGGKCIVAEEEDTFVFSDLGCVDECREYADSLRVKWAAVMRGKVDERLARLEELWKQCHSSDEEISFFKTKIESNLYSPLTIPILDSQISALETRLRKYSHIYSLITARSDYIRKIVEFEESARDPRRLFGRSTRLLEEEKFRRTCVPTLLHMEEELRRTCVAMEEEEMSAITGHGGGGGGGGGGGFMYGGKRYLDVLEQEISERFINTAVFVIDSLKSTTTTTTTSSKSSSSSSLNTIASSSSSSTHLPSSSCSSNTTIHARTPASSSAKSKLVQYRRSSSSHSLVHNNSTIPASTTTTTTTTPNTSSSTAATINTPCESGQALSPVKTGKLFGGVSARQGGTTNTTTTTSSAANQPKNGTTRLRRSISHSHLQRSNNPTPGH